MEHTEPSFLADPTFWVFIALVIFIGIVIKAGAFKAFGGLLSRHGEKIAAELDEARILKEEAQKILSEYKKKQSQAEQNAASIISDAKEQANRIRIDAEKAAANMITRRTKQAELKIAQAEQAAIREVSERATNIAIATVEALASDGMSAKQSQSLIADGIKEVQANI